MTRAAAGCGLRTLPDGEVGDRLDWVVKVINGLADHPDLEMVKEGRWADYQDDMRFRVRRGHRVDPETIDLGYAAAAERSYREFTELRQATPALEHTAFQVGLPSDLAFSFFSFGPVPAFAKRGLFRAALAREVTEIRTHTGDDAVFQIELPVETVLAGKPPGPLRGAMAGVLARGVAATVTAMPRGTRFGLHLCFGDLNRKSLVYPADAAALATLTNALGRAWPAGYPLEFVHLPLAFGDRPPVTGEAFYRPLAGLRLPEGVRLIAGLAHEDQSIGDQRAVLGMVERCTRREVAVANSCGLGRRDRELADAALARAVELAGT
ncbi:hypothetical protein [Amycolatopsis antarctica]|nr:hypothetical protein [Amycolatopsis antarctica]